MSTVINFYQINAPEKTIFTSNGAGLISDMITAHRYNYALVCKFRIKLKCKADFPKKYIHFSPGQLATIDEQARRAGIYE